MRNLILCLLLLCSFSFAAIDLNKASKDDLMAIKGLGEKKVALIIEYRKTHEIKTPEELGSLKGFGPKLIENIKNEIKVSN